MGGHRDRVELLSLPPLADDISAPAELALGPERIDSGNYALEVILMKATASSRTPAAAGTPNGSRRDLTPKQEQFVHEFLVDLNATQAAIRAGYSAKTADKAGPRLLTHPKVAAAIQKAREGALKRADLTLDKIVSEMRLIGFANIDAMLTTGPDGERILNIAKLGKLSQGQTAALRLKKEALVELGRHLGGFGSKLEVGGPNGGPIPVATSSLDVLAELPREDRDALRAILTRRLQSRTSGGPDSESA